MLPIMLGIARWFRWETTHTGSQECPPGQIFQKNTCGKKNDSMDNQLSHTALECCGDLDQFASAYLFGIRAKGSAYLEIFRMGVNITLRNSTSEPSACRAICPLVAVELKP